MKRAGLKNFTKEDIQKLRELEGQPPFEPEDFACTGMLDHIMSVVFWLIVLAGLMLWGWLL